MFDSIDMIYGRFHIKFGGPVMVNLLRRFGRLRTFDRRDCVFAILGLWQMFTGTKVLPHTLVPDYNLGVNEVYRISVQHAIEESDSLSPLEWINEPPREAQDVSWSSWPSWVPAIDRRNGLKNGPREFLAIFNADDEALMIQKKDYDLIVSGVLLDNVTERTPTLTPYLASPSDMQTLLEDMERPRRGYGVETLAAGSEMRTSLVLLGGSFRYTRIDHRQALQGYLGFKKHLKKHKEFPPKPRDLASRLFKGHTSVCEYWEGFWKAARYRAVFYTATGHMGLGPRCTQPGDIVAILYGSILPMVMRPLPGLPKGSYRLLGVCYVYGIMNGEAVRRHKEMGLKDEAFCIV